MALRFFLAVFALAACTRTSPRVQQSFQPLKATLNNSLYVVGSDFTTGAVTKVELSRGQVSGKSVPASSDASARWDFLGHQLIVVNRIGANYLSFVSPDLSLLGQLGLPDGSNPQDVIPLGNGEYYVSLFRSPSVLRVNGSRVVSEIDLSEYADPDGFPEAIYFHRTQDFILLTVARLDTQTDFQPVAPSYMLYLDPKSDSVVGERPLISPNPFTDWKTWGSKVCIGSSGNVGRTEPVKDGVIECVEPKGGGRAVATEDDLGGEIIDFEMLDDRTGVAIVGTPDTKLVRFDPEGKNPSEVVLNGTGYQYTQILKDDERNVLYLTDRDPKSPGIVVLDRKLSAIEGYRVNLSLPPFKVVLAP